MRRPCLICRRPTNGTRCPEHTRARGYTTAHWQTVRRARLDLDGHRCRLEHDGCTRRATTVHLDPHLNGNHLLATIDNTVSACLHCHGVEDGGRASNGRGVGGTPPSRERETQKTTPPSQPLKKSLGDFHER
jgi:hypothetical protein